MTDDKFLHKLQRGLYQIASKEIEDANNHELYLSLGMLLRETIGNYWTLTNKLYKDNNTKQIYYLSIEYLTGTFGNKNLQYLDLLQDATDVFKEIGIPIEDILAQEEDPGLGNGGLGCLAVAFLDSLSSLGMPGNGFGIRYEKGLFKQKIIAGQQIEEPDNWLLRGNIWEYKRDLAYEVKLGGNVEIFGAGKGLIFNHVNYERVKAVPYDIPYIGYKNNIVNTLRLWSAESFYDIDFSQFSSGNLYEAFKDNEKAKTITQFLYPDDSNAEGRKLRLKQEYFLVSASLQDIVKNYIDQGLPITEFDKYRAIHINDTHPVSAIPELMRILLDEFNLEWIEAWNITTNTFAFTNHTILPEAMERWDIGLIKEVIPRLWLIIEEINHRFVFTLKNKHKIDEYEKIRGLSLIENNEVKMANLAIIGSHSVNGVAPLHTKILKERIFKDFYTIFPEKFNNKTNGITHRTWLLNSNPELTHFIQEKIGDGFIRNPKELNKLLNYQDDKEVLEELMRIKHHNKEKLSKYILETQGIVINPYSIFDIHIKRIHEYKRQLLNILHIIHLYKKLKENNNLDIVPRTFIFSGKAAPGYLAAKEIIRLINAVANVINNDITIKEKLKVVFIENYNVSIAELLIPAADVSEQISTTTKEASGTGNMKLMMNGAITIATLDGANVEIASQVGPDNIIIFGLDEDQVYEYYKNNNYISKEIYYKNKDIKAVVDALISKNTTEFQDFYLLYDILIKHNDNYFVLRDFEEYRLAQEKINNLYRNREKWAKMSLINIAHSGVFSSDYTVKKYAEEIWGVESGNSEKRTINSQQ